MIKEFKEFLLRGNLLDLAVAVVIGAAFTGVVDGVRDASITPLIKAIFGGTTQFNGLRVHDQRLEDLLRQRSSTPCCQLRDRGGGDLLPGHQAGQRPDEALGRTPDEEPVRECPECLSKVPEAATAAPTAPRRSRPTAGLTDRRRRTGLRRPADRRVRRRPSTGSRPAVHVTGPPGRQTTAVTAGPPR